MDQRVGRFVELAVAELDAGQRDHPHAGQNRAERFAHDDEAEQHAGRRHHDRGNDQERLIEAVELTHQHHEHQQHREDECDRDELHRLRLFLVRAAKLDFVEDDVYGKTRSKEFLAVNPAHLTPMIESKGLPKGVMWESCAIMQYLANEHRLTDGA